LFIRELYDGAFAYSLGEIHSCARFAQQRSSGHAPRALLLAEPPSVDGGKITDKG
jgi:hypothetical protein